MAHDATREAAEGNQILIAQLHRSQSQQQSRGKSVILPEK
jgi:hypothetical protein